MMAVLEIISHAYSNFGIGASWSWSIMGNEDKQGIFDLEYSLFTLFLFFNF